MSFCIESTFASNSSGYPVIWHNNRIAYHHRVVAQALPRQVVMHICDNKRCINPEHLVIGSPAQNSADMVTKDRQAKGEACGNSKLSEQDVLMIRSLWGKLSSRKVAQHYNLSKTNVLDIWNKKIWRHI